MKRMINVILVMIGISSMAIIAIVTINADREIHKLKKEKQELMSELFKSDIKRI